jgi:hypothetical protein
VADPGVAKPSDDVGAVGMHADMGTDSAFAASCDAGVLGSSMLADDRP